MRKTTVLLLGVLAIGACSKDAVSPTDINGELDDAAELAYSSVFLADPGANFLPNLPALPDRLRLTTQQRTQIRLLLQTFAQDTRTQRDSLATLMRRAREAKRAGQPPDQVRAILAQGRTYREQLQAAEQKLHDDIYALLTAEQQAWLEAHRPGRCTAPRLTEEQKDQISALIAQFQQDNQADLDAVKAAHEQAREAIESGASHDEVLAILQAVSPAIVRLTTARLELANAIRAILTQEQVNARCGMPGFGPGPRAGMPFVPPLGNMPPLP